MQALEAGDLRKFAEIMKVHWKREKHRGGTMSSPEVDEWYQPRAEERRAGRQADRGRRGGFLMFCAEGKTSHRHALLHAGLREVRFRFDFEGTKSVIR
jgi:D-glycero-alpha-D-manno-heptose-7-phosphate kinase